MNNTNIGDLNKTAPNFLEAVVIMLHYPNQA